MLISIGSFFVFARFLAPQNIDLSASAPNSMRILALAALAITLVIVSLLVKRTILKRAVESQNVLLVQQGFIIAWAICEVGGLLGVVDRLVLGDSQYYVLFLIAAAGTTLNFPKREHLLAASPRIPIGITSS